MKTAYRTLDPAEADPELLTLAASAGSVAWGCAWMAEGLPLPPCAFHAITGCPCPTCGATRCVLALLHGRLAEAFSWNPLVFSTLAILLLINLYSIIVLLARLPRLRLSLTPSEARLLQLASLLLLAANWTYEIHHAV